MRLAAFGSNKIGTVAARTGSTAACQRQGRRCTGDLPGSTGWTAHRTSLWQGPLPFGSVELPLDRSMGAIGSAILHQIPILLEAIGCQGFEDLLHAQVPYVASRSTWEDGGTASTNESNGLLFLSFSMQASQSATIHTPTNGRDRLLFDTFQGCDVRTHKISGAVLKGDCMLAVQVSPQVTPCTIHRSFKSNASTHCCASLHHVQPAKAQWQAGYATPDMLSANSPRMVAAKVWCATVG